jgi:L-amino acid N-acyltransferase YncA
MEKKDAGSRRIRIEIRDASEEDLRGIVELWEMLVEQHRTYSDHFALARDGRRKWARYLRQKFAERSTKLIVAEEDGELVGFMMCLLSPQEPIFAEKATGVVSDAFVRKDRRKKGVMKEMLRVALRWFDKNKMKSVEVSVASANLEARAAWGQLGFKPFLVRKRLQLDKHHAQLLLNSKAPRKIVRRKKTARR